MSIMTALDPNWLSMGFLITRMISFDVLNILLENL